MLNSKITESDFSILNTAQLHTRFFLRKNRMFSWGNRLKGEIKKRSNLLVTPPQYFHHLAFDY